MRVTLAVRMAALTMRDPDMYRRLLQAGTQDSKGEWQQLIARLTNNETYFFRDKGQMTLLKERILPDLIERNQDRRTLRLWSAGCSTGEEPYSLAILVNELLPHRGAETGAPWDIVILGTDIDEQALQQARRASFGDWSFRTMEPAQKQHYFHRSEGGWRVAEEIRSMVTLGHCNLVSDPFPGKAMGIYAMDLILCRNVFIYFAPEAVSVVIPKFARSLREGGYLMTGHAEIQGQPIAPLQARTFPEALVYQRESDNSASHVTVAGKAQQPSVKCVSPPRVLPVPEAARAEGRPASHRVQVPAAAAATSAAAAMVTYPSASSAAPQTGAAEKAEKDAEALYMAGDYNAVVRTLQSLPEPAGRRALLLLAHAQANRGRYEEAAEVCQRLINGFPFASEPHELLAYMAQEQGQDEEAKIRLKKALYLAPASPSAYLELGALYEREGDKGRARTMRRTALELLEQMPAGSAVGAPVGSPIHEWISHLKQLMAGE